MAIFAYVTTNNLSLRIPMQTPVCAVIKANKLVIQGCTDKFS